MVDNALTSEDLRVMLLVHTIPSSEQGGQASTLLQRFIDMTEDRRMQEAAKAIGKFGEVAKVIGTMIGLLRHRVDDLKKRLEDLKLHVNHARSKVQTAEVGVRKFAESFPEPDKQGAVKPVKFHDFATKIAYTALKEVYMAFGFGMISHDLEDRTDPASNETGDAGASDRNVVGQSMGAVLGSVMRLIQDVEDVAEKAKMLVDPADMHRLSCTLELGHLANFSQEMKLDVNGFLGMCGWADDKKKAFLDEAGDARKKVKDLMGSQLDQVQGVMKAAANDLQRNLTDAKAMLTLEVGTELAEQCDAMQREIRQGLKSLQATYGDIIPEVADVFSSVASAAISIKKFISRGSGSTNRKQLWRVRERALFQMMRISAALKVKKPDPPPVGGLLEFSKETKQREREGQIESQNQLYSAHDENRAALEAWLMRRKVLEEAPGIQRTLDSKEFFLHMHSVLEAGIKTSKEQLDEEIKENLHTIEQIQDELLIETDPVKKQLGAVTLHNERKKMNAILSNVKDMGQAFPVMMSTLNYMTKSLELIHEKLDALAQDVKGLREDVSRLAGLPALKCLEEYQKGLHVGSNSKRRDVYIEPYCEIDGEREDLMEVVKKFMDDENKQVLLISGRAGSGKSVFASKLERYVLGDYWAKHQTPEKPETVVVIWANLPTLKNPLTGLFEEALQSRYHFLPHQVKELRDDIQKEDSRVIPVFVMDAYDELRPEFLFKN
eukprot:3512938-Rhodomonas_salina.1